MSDAHDEVNQAVERLRRLIHEHDRAGEEDTPFHLGIREILEERSSYSADAESAA